MQRLSSQGFVIHRRPYRETSMLIDVFTQAFGRISVVAKGVRGNTKSDRKSVLQPLQLISLECSGKSSLKNLINAEQVNQAYACKGNALYSAFYINELLQRALPESEAIEDLYAQYVMTLAALSELENPELLALEPILREFEFCLLANMGYLVDISSTADTGQEILPDVTYQYVNEVGFVFSNNPSVSLISGQSILDLQQKTYNKASLQVAKYIVRMTLPLVIGDKPLKSRELFKKR
ncbi:DNA repair protein RecO [Glaciecola sp. 1036]|uniref:DNA repair protein RecO n=1 Tax=Alteromonadaceae TaxID=72275 RepID=UPI003D08FB10